MRRLTAATVTTSVALTALTALAAPAAAARPSAYSQVLHAYQTQGSVPACAFSSAQLAAALEGVDTYGQQYFADFSAAVQSALAARAAGACSPARHRLPPVRVTPGPALPSSATAATEAGIPLVILVMAGLGLALAAAAGLGALTRSLGWEPAWLAGWRHAWAEAGYRIAGGWDEFTDWWRSTR